MREINKKVIFRKLFNTQLYQRIAEELGERKKTAEKELEQVRTECRTLVSNLELPSEKEARENGLFVEKNSLSEEEKEADLLLLQKLKSQIKDGKTLPIEEFFEGLIVLKDSLQKRCEQGEEDLKEAERKRDQAMAALAKGDSLKKAYEQLKEAEALLEECRKEEPGIQEMEAQIGRAHV